MASILAVLAASGVASSAFSEDFQSAAANLAKGYNQVFEAAARGGAGVSSASLYQAHVAGPSAALQKVQTETTQSVLSSMGVKVVSPESKTSAPEPAESDLSWVDWDGKAGKTAASTKRAPAQASSPGSSSEYHRGGGAAPAPEAPPVEPLALDGSSVPRELEFPGPAKTAHTEDRP